MKHRTRDGRLIPLYDLEFEHLKNIIKWIERKSKEGLIVRTGDGSSEQDMWYKEEIIFGEKAKKQLKLSIYLAEYKKRTKTNYYKCLTE
jgi:hypothetical protein